MIKQKLTLTLGLMTILLGSLAASPPEANAGNAVVQGTASDSSTAAGDTFAPAVETLEIQVQTNEQGISADVDPATGEVNISVTQQVQANLDAAATEAISEIAGGGDTTGGSNIVVTIATTDAQNTNTVEEAANSVEQETGVNIEPLLEEVQGLLASGTQAQVSPAALVATAKNLKSDSVIPQAQPAQSPQVDINKLHRAINAYNTIVKESDLPTLQKLSKNEIFMDINKLLKALRVAVR
jgi:hypothetical protein